MNNWSFLREGSGTLKRTRRRPENGGLYAVKAQANGHDPVTGPPLGEIVTLPGGLGLGWCQIDRGRSGTWPESVRKTGTTTSTS